LRLTQYLNPKILVQCTTIQDRTGTAMSPVSPLRRQPFRTIRDYADAFTRGQQQIVAGVYGTTSSGQDIRRSQVKLQIEAGFLVYRCSFEHGRADAAPKAVDRADPCVDHIPRHVPG